MVLKGLRRIVKHPYINKRTALKYFLRSPSLFFTIYQNPSKFYFSLTLENILSSNFISCFHNFLPERFLEHLAKEGFADHDGVRLILYAIVRACKPEIVVETGVAHGQSSAFMLCAMHENQKGHLYSIDLPPYDACIKNGNAGGKIKALGDGQTHWIKEKYPIGDFVPEYLRDRWTLILGDAKKELPTLLKEIGNISIFFHDSLHTYEHMLFEYETAWPHITNDGFLLSHDVLWNKAFLDFSKKVDSKPLIYYSLSIIKK